VVYFKLEGTLPSEYESYKQYYYRMEDTINTNIYKLESGATHPVQEIYRLHANGSKTPVDSSKIDAYTTWDEATGNLVIDFGNLKDHPHALNPNDRIVVKLKFSLVGSPVVGKGNDDGMGNVNTATLFYSNDPNQADVELDEGENYVDKIKMGSTSDDASVYTYGIELKKVAAANTSTALPGAEFVLSRKITSSSSGTETTTIYYAIVEQDANVTDKNVYKVKQWVADKNNSNLTMTTGEDGTFTVTGLDGVQYHLTETKAPAGYNKLTEDVLVNIQATINATSGVLTELKGTADSKNATGDTTTGILSFNIVNNGGATLPETGGMGTTIFYIAGGALMIGAAAVLIAKKRETEK